MHRPSDHDSCAGCHSQLPQHVTARCHSMSQLGPGSRDAFSQTVMPRRICGCDTGFGQQSFLQERLQVSLERATVRSGTESLVVPDREAPLLDDVAERGCFPVGQGVLTHKEVPADRTLSSDLDLIELGGEPCREELEPPREVHVVLADPLERPIEGGAIPVVVLAESE